VLVNSDMKKSVDFLMKISAVSILDRHGNLDKAAAAVMAIYEEAQGEWSGRPVS
jgi:hypothetical protein